MQKVVVGIDGSPESRLALRWAAQEARVHGAVLEVVHGYVPPEGFYAPHTHLAWEAARSRLEKDARADAERLLDELIAERDDGVVLRRTVQATRQPARLLVALARDADLLVVGSRGRGGFAGLLLGSVSQQCVHHASCPVVVVRGRG